MKINKSIHKQVINAPISKVWEVLFTDYGDIHIHNPGMIASYNLDNAASGGLNCVRYCQFNEKLSLEEKITEVEEGKHFTIVVTKHNLPFIKHMSATYQLSTMTNSTGAQVTELTMTSSVAFSPSFMKFLMTGQLSKGLVKHLFGLKYFIETGKTVNADNYDEVLKEYQK